MPRKCPNNYTDAFTKGYQNSFPVNIYISRLYRLRYVIYVQSVSKRKYKSKLINDFIRKIKVKYNISNIFDTGTTIRK